MITLIAAIAENNCIGVAGKLPWSIPEDLARFKTLTMGYVVLMGRRTWESLPQKFRPLPGRTNVVITRQADYAVPDGVACYDAIDAALAAHAHTEVFIIGGADIYQQTIARADRLELTHVHCSVDGDAFFPAVERTQWDPIARDDRTDFSFATYERIRVTA